MEKTLHRSPLPLRYNFGYTFPMKTAISIPDKLFAAAEREAKRRGVSRSKFYQEALEVLMKARKSHAVTEALNKSLAASPDPDDPMMDRLTKATMARVEWSHEAGRDLVDGHRRAKRVGAGVSKARRHRVGK